MSTTPATPKPKQTTTPEVNKRTPAQQVRLDRHYAKKAAAVERLRQKVEALGDEALLDEYEMAAYLDKSVQSLRNWRINGGLLPFIKIGAAVRYRVADIKASF